MILKQPLRLIDEFLLRVGGVSLYRQLGLPVPGEGREAALEGHFALEVRERGKKVASREGKNVCTLTGREFFLARAVLAAVSPTRTQQRLDCLRYIGLGSGTQPEVSGVSALAAPMPYIGAEFLAPLQLPVWVDDTGGSGTRTAIQLIREYAGGEVSLGATATVSEAGLYSDGDPTNDWDITAAPTDLASASSRAPFFYRTFDPIIKTTDRTIRIVWTIRHL